MNTIQIIGTLAGRLCLLVIVVALIFAFRRKNSDASKGGYCLKRTRNRLVYLPLAILFLFLALAMGAFSVLLLKEDWSLWDYTDYITLAVGIGGTLAFAAGGIYEGYTAIRDAFFPEKSRLANSIRSQLPNPDMAPGVQELFAMVDKDIAENGQWFDRIAIGKEWVLGDDATYIPRIRAVFGRNELKTVHRKSRTQATRIIQLLIVDDRQQVQITGLRNPRELEAILTCLRLRTPAALFLPYKEYTGFCGKTDLEWASMERDFRQRQAQMAPQTRQTTSDQNIILTDAAGVRTSLVTSQSILAQIDSVIPGKGFELEFLRPIPAGDKGQVQKMRWVTLRDKIVLVASMMQNDGVSYALQKSLDKNNAQNIMMTVFETRSLPDFSDWTFFQEDI